MKHSNMIKAALCAILVVLGTQQAAAQSARYGINISEPKDWSREQPFLNVMKLARPWISQSSAQWDTREQLPMDKHGYVTGLKPGQWAGTVLLTEVGDNFPGGRYVFLYDGKGEFQWDQNGKRISKSEGREVIEVTPGERGFVHLAITSIDPDDYPRNLRFVREEFENTFEKQPFSPEFLSAWADADTIRFMDWQMTNHSQQEKWQDRPVPEDCSFWKKGVALEYIIQLANQVHASIWVCIPHLADDDYIRNCAEMVRNTLNKDLTAYYEYSNEVWNGMFSQSRWANEQGQKAGLNSAAWKAGLLFYAQQCNRMYSILDAVYENEPAARYRKVAATQAGNVGVTQIILPYENCGENADVLAIAPYITFNIPLEKSKWQPNIPTATELEGWSLDQIFDYLYEKALPDSLHWMDQHKDLADKYDLELTCYEGGQHLTALGDANRNKVVVDLLKAANHDPRMGDLYKKYLAYWNEIGGKLFCLYNSTTHDSPSGYWGLLEYSGQDPASSPKYMAVKEWAKQLPSYKAK